MSKSGCKSLLVLWHLCVNQIHKSENCQHFGRKPINYVVLYVYMDIYCKCLYLYITISILVNRTAAPIRLTTCTKDFLLSVKMFCVASCFVPDPPLVNCCEILYVYCICPYQIINNLMKWNTNSSLRSSGPWFDGDTSYWVQMDMFHSITFLTM